MATTADFRNGMCIEFNGQLYFIVQFQHVKPGKGAAFVRTKLRNVSTGKVLENTFNSGVKVDEARIERRPHQFLYKDDLGYNFMNSETFEQVQLDEKLIDNAELLKEGQEVEVVYHADTENPLMVNLPPFINFEITESAAVESGHILTENMKALRELGCSFSMDDFGTGYSNLSQMADVSYDLVKLDKSLIWPCFEEDSHKPQVVLQSIVKMTRDLDSHLVAEGVETAQQAEALAAMGVQYLQGYLYSKPIDSAAYLSFLHLEAAPAALAG